MIPNINSLTVRRDDNSLESLTVPQAVLCLQRYSSLYFQSG